jgi:DNA-binding response OmpR family regulator
MTQAKILLAEDNQSLGFLLKENLEDDDFDISWQQNGIAAWNTFCSEEFDLCLLDIILPGIDGIELAKRIRKKRLEVPIIFITARSLNSDIITGYEVGCDDYIVKPFEEYRLRLKINALLARTKGKKPAEAREFYCGDLRLDTDLQQISWPGGETRLNRIENQILKILLGSEGKIVPRNTILDTVWGRSDIYTSKSLDTYLYAIRKHLKQTNLMLENIYGTGYVIKQSPSIAK